MNNESGELSPEFLAEIKNIIKIIIDRYHLKCTSIEDKRFADEIISLLFSGKKHHTLLMSLIKSPNTIKWTTL